MLNEWMNERQLVEWKNKATKNFTDESADSAWKHEEYEEEKTHTIFVRLQLGASGKS